MRLTAFQCESLGKIAVSYMADRVEVSEHTFDLPKDYIAFELIDEHNNTLLAGGIAPGGQVHT